MPIVQIPTAAEVRDGGGDILVEGALRYLEPYLCRIDEGNFRVKTEHLISNHNKGNPVLWPQKEAIRRVMTILETKGWKVRLYDENSEHWMEIGQPSN